MMDASKVVRFFGTLPLRELRRRQRMNDETTARAFHMRNDGALKDAQENALLLADAVDRRTRNCRRKPSTGEKKMSREYLDGPKGIQIDTPFGVLTVGVQSADRMSMSSPEPVSVHGVRMTVTVRFEAGTGGMCCENWYGIYARRTGDCWAKDVSEAAKRKLKTVLEPVAREWAAEHGELFAEAERASRNNCICSLESEIERFEADVAERRKRIALVEATGKWG